LASLIFAFALEMLGKAFLKLFFIDLLQPELLVFTADDSGYSHV
jgi:hypothetical protein